MEQITGSAREHGYSRFKALLLSSGLPFLYILTGLYGLGQYLEWRSVNMMIGIIALPLMFSGTAHAPRSHRFAWIALFLVVLLLLFPAKTLLYGVWCSLLLHLYECRKGKTGPLPVLTAFMMTPVCSYFAQMFSFPVRLWLTEVAGSLLQHGGQDVVVEGNIMIQQQQEYSVDPACMGLNMLVTSLLCGLIMLAAYQKKTGRVLSLPWMLFSLLLILVFNIAANLIRILLLVYLRLMPDNAMHGMMGIICLVIYVLLPGWFFIRKLVSAKGKLRVTTQRKDNSFNERPYLQMLLLPLFAGAVYFMDRPVPVADTSSLPQVEGYTTSWYSDEVVKMERSHSLIYVKKLRGFFSSDHNPLICWTACGYTFEHISHQQYGAISLYTGMLSKGNERLYTAWWYDNGSTATVSQWSWRWLMMRGKPAFCIINVTAASQEALQQEIGRVAGLRKQILGPVSR